MNRIPNQPKPPKKNQSEFRLGEIVAPRFWVFDDEYLYGPSFWRMRWEPNAPVSLPTIDHTLHGVYAWKDDQLIYNWLANNQTHDVIVGTVRLWGSVIEYELGYRAQHARINSLVEKVSNGKPMIDDDHIRRLRQRYGVGEERK